jgi:hypothetical protein
MSSKAVLRARALTFVDKVTSLGENARFSDKRVVRTWL